MKSDISISVSELGSLLDHSVHTKKQNSILLASLTQTAATGDQRYFHCEQNCWYVLSSGSSTILIDRNCHKSLTHLMMMAMLRQSISARPVTLTVFLVVPTE